MQLGVASFRELIQASSTRLGDALKPLYDSKGRPNEYDLVCPNGIVHALKDASSLSLKVVGVLMVPLFGGG